MPKINCNIIKDLLPSYIDELCSIESKQLIHEHFEECENCRKLYEQTKLEILHSNSTIVKEIDYFKSIRINVNKKNKSLLIVTGILFFIQVYFNFDPYRFNSDITMYVNYIFPVLIAGTLFAILPDYTEQKIPNKIKLPILAVEFTAMTYVFILMTFVANILLNGSVPFGMKAEEIGPFLAVQILAFAVFFILAFVATLILSLRKKAISPALCFVPLGGLSLMFEYIQSLHELSSCFGLPLFIQPVVIVCEMIILVGIYMFVNRKKVV